MEVKDIVNTDNFKGLIKFDEPMSLHTSLQIGGPVDVMAFPEDPLSLRNVMKAAKAENIPVFILGGGTNLLVSDIGIRGIAVSLKGFTRIEVIENLQNAEEGCVTMFVEAGASLPRLIAFTEKNGYSGIEALAGIPGTVGGAVYMNAGSFGAEIKDVIDSVAVMNKDGKISMLKKDELKFSYRSSNISDDLAILSANIILKKETTENVAERVREFLKKKKLTQPVKEHSAGCVFKNPAGGSAGRLIDEAGCKGMRMGGIEVNSMHANFFVNKGGGRCEDFIKLMDTVKEKVKVLNGVALEPEIKIFV
ncbi:MAG: UDP-N-acetylmuramate dehydrogenase [Nitrospirae bacterium]|nr:UDP-N-acetylmuramate dehydrogenase [Nitrospirota bacterium]